MRVIACLLLVLSAAGCIPPLGLPPPKPEPESEPAPEPEMLEALAQGTMTIGGATWDWCCWYDEDTGTLIFATPYEAGPGFEDAFNEVLFEVEGELPVEDPRVIHVRKALDAGGCRIAEKGTLFYFRPPGFSTQFLHDVVRAMNETGIVERMTIDTVTQTP